MKKLIMVAFVSVVFLTVILSGCTTSTKAFTEPSQIINTGVNQEFTIALGSNISTGIA